MKKNEKMLHSMELIDEKYVAEADPTKVKRRLKHPKLLALAACFTLLLTGLNLWLFIPFSTRLPDISRYSDSEYYPIIEKLNKLTYKPPAYKNNFEKLRDSFLMAKGEDANGGVTESPSVKVPIALSQTYSEVTDNQVTGVIEGDLIKRSDKYIYYLNAGKGSLHIYSIDGVFSDGDGNYLTDELGRYFIGSYHDHSQEFYLSSDCRTVTVICTKSSDATGTWTQVLSLDVSDPTNIRERAKVDITGYYNSSRMVDGKLLLLNSYYFGNNINFDDESTFLPQIDTGDGFVSIPMEDIIVPETLTDTRYTVVCRLDEQTLALEDAAAFLSYSKEVYVSTDTIYVTHGYNDVSEEKNGYKTTVAMTEISALSYTGEQFELLGSIAVKGTVKDQYSLDEHEGILRVVTTTSYNRMRESSNGEIMSVELDRNSGTSASLYCIDLAGWEIVAEVENFAPKGETVQSVRFDGDSAYVCTAVVVTLVDPVFFFDLSDLSNITYKDTGVIEGYSSSLINIGDGYLLGIGVGIGPSGHRSVKLEVYTESEKGVESFCAYELEDGFTSTDYKSYLVDRENGLFGLGVDNLTYYIQDEETYERYMLFHFDGSELKVLVDEPLSGNYDFKRAVYIDDYLYMFSDEEYKIVKVGLTDE